MVHVRSVRLHVAVDARARILLERRLPDATGERLTGSLTTSSPRLDRREPSLHFCGNERASGGRRRVLGIYGRRGRRHLGVVELRRTGG